MAGYMTYSKELGKMITVPDLNECLEAIRIRAEHSDERIKSLTEENKQLKDAAYKDNQVKEMKERLDTLQENYYRGFPISKEEQDAIEAWKIQHDLEVHKLDTLSKRMRASGVSGGRYTYHFLPTSIGVSGTIECSCGAKFEFQKIE